MSVTHLTTTQGRDQFYPTPPELAARMVEKIDVWDVRSILEPSAGKGDLIKAYIKAVHDIAKEHRITHRMDFDIDAIEIDGNLRQILRHNITNTEVGNMSLSDKFRIVHDDFLSFKTIKKYSLILMNPPFADGDRHLLKALDIQKDGGQIICLLNAETLRNPHTRTRQLLVSKLREYEADIEYVEDAFSTAERKADVDVAIVHVQIPTAERPTSDIWERMKAAAEAEHIPDPELTALVPSGYIEQAICLYNAEIAATMELYREYQALVPYIRSDLTVADSGPIIRLTVGGGGYFFDMAEYRKAVRLKYWKALFHNPEFTARLTSNLQEKWRRDIDRLAAYEFSAFNIKQVMVEMNASMQQGIVDTIMTLFDTLTYVYAYNPELNSNRLHFDGWKTNCAYKVGKKVIKPTYGTYSEYSWDKGKGFRVDRAFGTLSDIEKAFDYLDGGKFEGERIDLRPALQAASDGLQHRNVECTYFLVDIFKKGTIHIKFRPEAMPLVERLNIYAAQGKAWLPPRAYKTPYNNLDAEEKAVMDSFGGDGTEGSGEKAYNEVLKDPAYYLSSPGGQMLMLTSGK